MAFLDLPPDIVLLILEELSVKDTLALRQTSRLLKNITQERSIWLMKLMKQKEYLPFPSEALERLSEEVHGVADYPLASVENLVTTAERNDILWSSPRLDSPRAVNAGSSPFLILMGLELLLDRWLLVACVEGCICLYSTHDNRGRRRQRSILFASLRSTSEFWSTYAVSADPEVIMIAVVTAESPYKLFVYSININVGAGEVQAGGGEICLVTTLHLHNQFRIRALDHKSRRVVLSDADIVRILRWDDTDELIGMDMPINGDGSVEEFWNGIVAAELIGPYLLLFKTRALELHGCLESDSSSSLPLSKHQFTHTFRDVSFSTPTHQRHRYTQEDTYRTTILAHDTIYGLYQYEVTVTLTTDPNTPRLDVNLVSEYPLYVVQHATQTSLARHLSPTANAEARSATASPSPLFGHGRTMGLPEQQMETKPRGFISTYRLGRQAKRAVWVERKRSSMLREVHVWSKPREYWGENGEMKSTVVYSLSSYDLSKDLVCCAFGEVDGTIVLGYRSGSVAILGTNDSWDAQ